MSPRVRVRTKRKPQIFHYATLRSRYNSVVEKIRIFPGNAESLRLKQNCISTLRSSAFRLPKAGETVHFFCCVVVCQPDAQKAAVFLYIEVLGQVESVVVASPR